MREILFRGQRVDNGEWVYGSLIIDCDNSRMMIPSGKGVFAGEKVITETVSQHTGLTDKNGIKIFEGDKVSNGTYIYIVEYNTQNSSFCLEPIERVKGEFTIVDSIDYQRLGNGYYTRKDLEIVS